MTARKIVESELPGSRREGWLDVGEESTPIGEFDGALTLLDAAYGVADALKQRFGDDQGSRLYSEFQRDVQTAIRRGETSGTSQGFAWKYRQDPETSI